MLTMVLSIAAATMPTDTTPVCRCFEVPATPAQASSRKPQASPQASAAGIPPPADVLIDILVVYTPSARDTLGGTAAAESDIADRVAYTNAAFEVSGVFHRLRLVHVGEIAYAESGNTLTDLARLRALSDGFLDDVHALRDSVGADLVCLVGTSPSAGTGYHMTELSTDFASSAFSAIGAITDPIPEGLVLAHETGHNCGLTHNNGPGAPASLFCYSYGYRTPDEQWRTIMSSPPGAFVQRFSSPDLMVEGQPLGVAGDGCPSDAAHATRSLNEAAPTVAKFRPTMIPLCPADTDNSGSVDVNDLVTVITGWGDCGGPCPGDVTGDGTVGVDDLVAVVEQWGGCETSKRRNAETPKSEYVGRQETGGRY